MSSTERGEKKAWLFIRKSPQNSIRCMEQASFETGDLYSLEIRSIKLISVRLNVDRTMCSVVLLPINSLDKNWEKPEINLRTKLNIIFCQIKMKMWNVNLVGVRTVLRILEGRYIPRTVKVYVKFWLGWRYIRMYLCGVMRWLPSPMGPNPVVRQNVQNLSNVGVQTRNVRVQRRSV